MRFDVYCDESRPDLFSSKNRQGKFLVIGSLWLRYDDRQKFKEEIHLLRDRYKVGGEFKWGKVSPSRVDFYKELAKWFFDKKLDLRFRAVVIDAEKVDLMTYHGSDQELGFYKFYYQMLHHWVLDCNEYAVFCDFKSNRKKDRLIVLKDVLSNSNLSSRILSVQPVKSEESVFIQLVDVLTGAVSAKFNNSNIGSAKEELFKIISSELTDRKMQPTPKTEEKFNIFNINLCGGW
ncbi:MAG TPA: DUF3800 domain-containing protein [bacterium]|nr:DUF3800 domain-containing protein [bacterium]